MDVTWDDQVNINMFSKLNMKSHELASQIKHKKAELENLEDASNEMMLLDDEVVKHAFGECFIHVDKDTSEELINANIIEVQKEVADAEQEYENVRIVMVKLKGLLYGKFGGSINLEED